MKTVLFDRPWLLLPEFHATLVERVKMDFRADVQSPWAATAPKLLVRSDGVGGVTVSGALMKRPNGFERYFGASDMDEISAELKAADAHPAVRAIILSVDSPGGTVTGTPELGRLVKDCAKPTAAFTDSLAASAAYWIASQADAVYASPSAQVGSIGVLLPVYDWSAAYKAMGVKVELFTGGKYKGAGAAGTSLTDEQRELLQANVSALHDAFKAAVKSRRPRVADADMEGQVFRGGEAARRGLVTGLAADVDEVAAKILARL